MHSIVLCIFSSNELPEYFYGTCLLYVKWLSSYNTRTNVGSWPTMYVRTEIIIIELTTTTEAFYSFTQLQFTPQYMHQLPMVRLR